MKSLGVLLACFLLCVTAAARPKRPIIAAYYFPGYHADERNQEEHAPGWTEWDLLKATTPSFGGHRQPRVPMWGYLDESDPAVMAKKIDAAADHGVDALIFDWYWYEGKSFLNKALDNGFLKAPNSSREKFALMWANHDLLHIHPQMDDNPALQFAGKVNETQFDDLCDHVIKDYFSKPNYLQVDGKPYFSIYEMFRFVDSFGGFAHAKEMLARFRQKAQAAGFKGIHFNAVVWGLKVAGNPEGIKDQASMVKYLGIDSVTSYVWLHDYWPPDEVSDYNDFRDGYFKWWDAQGDSFGVPYYPDVTVGWDPGPRRYRPNRYIVANTPQRFQDALEMTWDRLGRHHPRPDMIFLNAWNEWTEGSYLEPDTQFGNRYLDAVKNVFGLAGR